MSTTTLMLVLEVLLLIASTIVLSFSTESKWTIWHKLLLFFMGSTTTFVIEHIYNLVK